MDKLKENAGSSNESGPEVNGSAPTAYGHENAATSVTVRAVWPSGFE